MPQLYRRCAGTTAGAPAERGYAARWLNAVLEDAVEHALRRAGEVQWAAPLRAVLGGDVEIARRQLGRHGAIICEGCEAQIDEVIRQEIALERRGRKMQMQGGGSVQASKA